MRRILNWTLGSFFRTLGRFAFYIFLGFLISLLLSNFNFKKLGIINPFVMNVSAATLTSYGTYTGNTNSFSSCGSSGTYSFSTIGPSVTGNHFWQYGNIGTTYSGQAYAMSFLFKNSLTAQKTYDVVITAKNNDFTNRITASSINIFNGSSCDDMYKNDISLISFTNKATSSTNSNNIKFRIYANSIITWWGFNIFGNSKNITSVNNFGISSISITEVDTSGNNQVIENNNNNTNIIINNQNQTTQELIDNQNQTTQEIIDNQNQNAESINNNLVTKCTNLFNGNITSSNQNLGTYKPNTKYYLKFKGTLSGVNIKTEQNGTVLATCSKCNSITFTTSSNGKIYFNSWGAVVPLTDVMLSEEDLPYCPFGSSSSKIDNITDTLNDGNIDESESTISNFFNSFQDNDHGLSSIVSAPLRVVNSMLEGTCSPLTTIYNGQVITIPCGDYYLWGKPNVAPLKTFLNLIYGGWICYGIIISLFQIIEKLKNPENDRIEVENL